MKRPALQNKWVGVLGMAFRASKVFGSFEKRTPGLVDWKQNSLSYADRLTKEGINVS